MYECAEEFRWLYTHSGGLDEDGESEPRTGFERTVRRADGSETELRTTVFAARMEKRETMNAVRKRFVYQHVPN